MQHQAVAPLPVLTANQNINIAECPQLGDGVKLLYVPALDGHMGYPLFAQPLREAFKISEAVCADIYRPIQQLGQFFVNGSIGDKVIFAVHIGDYGLDIMSICLAE